jgi:hypothetical protein
LGNYVEGQGHVIWAVKEGVEIEFFTSIHIYIAASVDTMLFHRLFHRHFDVVRSAFLVDVSPG